MIKKTPFLILLLLLSCTSNDKIKQKVDDTENLNFEHDFKIYNHKDSIDINELITSDEGDDAILDSPETFVYMDSERQIRMSIFMNKKWRTWTIHDAQNEKYFAEIHRKDFDNIGNNEIVVQSKYGISPQSTFGSSYYGDFQIWNPDSIKLYFEIENYEYSDDMGRNGEQTFTDEHFLDVEVKEKQIFVNSIKLDSSENNELYLVDELLEEYFFKNGIVVKKKN